MSAEAEVSDIRLTSRTDKDGTWKNGGRRSPWHPLVIGARRRLLPGSTSPLHSGHVPSLGPKTEVPLAPTDVISTYGRSIGIVKEWLRQYVITGMSGMARDGGGPPEAIAATSRIILGPDKGG